MLQVVNKRRIVIDDDDDWPLPCPKSDTDGQSATDLYCREQCVAEGIVVLIDAVVEEINPAGTTSAVPGPSSDMPALLSDSEDDSGSDADVDDVPISAPLRRLLSRETFALRTLGLLNEADTPEGSNSRRAFELTQGWVVDRAIADTDLVDAEETMLESDDDNLDYCTADVPHQESKDKPSWQEAWAMRVLGLLKNEDSSKGPHSRRVLELIHRWIAAQVEDAIAPTVEDIIEQQHRGTSLPT